MFLRIFKDTAVPKYKSGKWIWDELTESYRYIPNDQSIAEPECVIPTPTQRGLYHFRYYLDQVEEIIFRGYFSRVDYSNDSDVITVQDVKNVVLFMAPSEIMTDKFIDFVYTKTVDKFLNALVIYFEYFLKVVEFLLIRRDELTEKFAKIQTLESIKIKQMLADNLSQYRLLLAREYCKILLGTNDMAAFHHIEPKVKASRTIKDRAFHEAFIAFITQFAWIAHHRRAYKVIDCEINRLIRSGHFNMAETKDANNIVFSKIEQQVLYGRNDKRANFRAQKSPLVQEIVDCSHENLPVLWIGERKYRGTDLRIAQLEREFVIPESQILLIDVSHGILGHPKEYYNTMLVLDWHTVRKFKFNENYDPFKIWRQPYLEIPEWKNYIKKHYTFQPYFEFTDIRYQSGILKNQKSVWRHRDTIVKRIKARGIVNNIILRCEKEIEDMSKDIHIDRERIISDFLWEKNKRKHKE